MCLAIVGFAGGCVARPNERPVESHACRTCSNRIASQDRPVTRPDLGYGTLSDKIAVPDIYPIKD